MKSEEKTYPPLNMHFIVRFDGQNSSSDSRFQSVNGLQARICTDEENKSRYTKYENIVLKRAYQPDSKLIEWCMNAINNNKKQPKNLTIELLNTKHEPISAWNIAEAIPVGWGVEQLHAQDTKILIEFIELEYKYFQILDAKGTIIAPIHTTKE